VVASPSRNVVLAGSWRNGAPRSVRSLWQATAAFSKQGEGTQAPALGILECSADARVSFRHPITMDLCGKGERVGEGPERHQKSVYARPSWWNPRSACRCFHFGIWAPPWASQSDDKTALRGDRPIKTMRSRDLSSLPENRTVFSSTCRNSVRFCAVGRHRRPSRGLWSLQWQSPTAQYRYAIFSHPL
jgi:hypothetical protein